MGRKEGEGKRGGNVEFHHLLSNLTTGVGSGYDDVNDADDADDDDDDDDAIDTATDHRRQGLRRRYLHNRSLHHRMSQRTHRRSCWDRSPCRRYTTSQLHTTVYSK